MVTGGRIETHFHVFGSLAFLAFYRDWKVVVTATLVVVADHLARGLLWPDSVYGTQNPEWWRFLEHAGWVVFEDIVLVYACIRQLADRRRAAEHEAALEDARANVEAIVDARTAELRDSNDRYRLLIENTAAIPFEWDIVAHRTIYLSPQLARVLGYPYETLVKDGFVTSCCEPEDVASFRHASAKFLAGTWSPSKPVEMRMRSVTGEVHYMAVFHGRVSEGRYLSGVMLDMTQQRQLEVELAQAQKLESVGRLAAGVAHEINTPVQFVGDSIGFVRDSLAEVFQALDPVRAADPELAYVLGEYPRALDRALEGLDRVTTIVRSMKVFAHQAQEKTTVDLNQSLEATLVVARSEYKLVADVETEFTQLPRVRCHAGELHQVFLNILINAAHAIEDAVGATGQRGTIGVATRRDGDDIVVSISDTGTGIPESARAHVFDPFYTTKQVGRGTGQGLAIARTIVVDKHQGSLAFDTELGAGTTFHIRIPIAASRDSWRSAA
jgi:PAS domain S-box-containing protein